MATRFRPGIQSDFGGGINTASPATEIADNEAVDILNFEFDQTDNLKTRRGTVKYTSATPPSTTQRVTSLFQLLKADGTKFLIKTHGNDIRSITTTTDTSIKGALTLPSDTYWQWVTFNDFAIGVNRGSGANSNPVKWTGIGNATALGGTPPKGKYIETWNSRVFIVDNDNPNKVVYSKLGDGENYTDVTSGAIEVGFNDGDEITGIKAHRKAFFVFKRNRIYVITTGTPNTDPNLWRVDIFSGNIGCVSAYTIQPVLDDLLFLSDAGVVSLAAVQQFGDFRQALYSVNIQELQTLNHSVDTFASVVNVEDSQYWLSVPNSLSGANNGHTYVMDYRQALKGKIRWTRFDNKCAGSTMAFMIDTGRKRVLIGTTANQIFRYGDAGIFKDDGGLYTKTVTSKAYSFEDELIRKEFNHFGVSVELLACPLQLGIVYQFNLNPNLSKSRSVNFTCDGTTFSVDANGNSTGTGTNTVDARWDIATWDAVDANGNSIDDNSGLPFVPYGWARTGNNLRDVYFRFSGDPGRRGKNVQFIISNAILGQAFALLELKVETKLLSTQRLTKVI